MRIEFVNQLAIIGKSTAFYISAADLCYRLATVLCCVAKSTARQAGVASQFDRPSPVMTNFHYLPLAGIDPRTCRKKLLNRPVRTDRKSACEFFICDVSQQHVIDFLRQLFFADNLETLEAGY